MLLLHSGTIAAISMLLRLTPVHGFALPPSRRSQPALPGHHPASVSTLMSSRIAAIDSPASLRASHSRNVTETMWSYVYNLQKTRSLLDEQKRRSLGNDLKNLILRPVRSLYFFLLDNVHLIEESETIGEPLQRALTQSVRLAGSVNDYKLILQLVGAVDQYCLDKQQQHPHAIVDPRVLGEAVTALGKTTVNTNKIRKVWRTSSQYRCWSRPIGPREVNALLQVLQDRRKVKSMLNLYHTSVTAVPRPTIDPYSLSIVLHGLRHSVAAEPKQLLPKSNETRAPLQQSFLNDLIDPSSPYWQWEEAIRVIDASFSSINNPVVSALLQLNVACAKSDPTRHDGAQMATLLHQILATHMSMDLDEVTYTIILQSLGTQHEAALKILGSFDGVPTNGMVGAAAAVCLRGRQYASAMQLVEEKLMPSEDPVDQRLYRALLQALVRPRNQKRRRTRQDRMDAVERMRCALQITSLLLLPSSSDGEVALSCRSLLAVLANVQGLLKPIDWQSMQQTLAGDDASATPLLLQYPPRNETVSLSSSDFFAKCTLGILDARGLAPCPMTLQLAISSLESKSIVPFLQTVGGIPSDAAFNATLRMLAKRDDAAEHVLELVMTMQQLQHPWDAACLLSLVHSLGRHEVVAPHLANLLLGNDVDLAVLETGGANLSLAFQPPLIDERHFTSGLCSCLLRSDFVGARKLLMRLHEEPHMSQESTQQIAFAFATKALDGKSHQKTTTARSRAMTAYQMLKNLHAPSISLLIIVARACHYCGLPAEAREILQQLHTTLTGYSSSSKRRDDHIRAVASLHQDMLRHSAKNGNLADASGTYSCIEDVSNRLLDLSLPNAVEEAACLSTGALELKLLLKAATRAGDWQECLRTFQSLRPFVEATNVGQLADNEGDATRFDAQYGRLEDALTETTKCLSRTRQYAWVLRVLNDWIAWGGRRPPVAAMQNAMRTLASKFRGRELCAIVLQCASMKSSNTTSDDDSYLPMLFSSAVTSLYKNGMYDLADDMFLSGVGHGAIPISCTTQTDEQLGRNTTVDLHGFNLAMAHSAVRVSLQREAMELSEKSETRVTIVTGRGLRSALRLRPVLRPAVQQMLVEEFYPPLGSSTVPWNTGALEINPTDVIAWTENQKCQKGARMLIVAAMLKSVARPLPLAISQAIDPQ